MMHCGCWLCIGGDLQFLDHPFLPTLYSHFETEKFSCLVMEFCPGGDLHALRQRQPGKYFSEHAARFYVAEVLLALEYLHMLGVIYRDLKPENVLVREDRHIMLSDFDLSLRCAVCPTLVKSSNLSLESKNSAYCVQPACIEPTCVIQPACIQPTCFGQRFLSNKPKKEKKAKPKSEIYHQVTPLPELIALFQDAIYGQSCASSGRLGFKPPFEHSKLMTNDVQIWILAMGSVADDTEGEETSKKTSRPE
ncbi:hypothetical protein L1049_012405 [Liquidambar formosana]|uniref:non-specific serine/threonine protein kinase n=1 Tax=Liquidambar formosana TaxID=63359 RepID=A0AAP0N504_LIQFO